jgi:hypothetical protein
VYPDQNRMRRGLTRRDVFAVGIELAITEHDPLRHRAAGRDSFRICRPLSVGVDGTAASSAVVRLSKHELETVHDRSLRPPLPAARSRS